jgi:hypothetical protein
MVSCSAPVSPPLPSVTHSATKETTPTITPDRIATSVAEAKAIAATLTAEFPTSTLTATNTKSPSPTMTLEPTDTLEPERAQETIQPLLREPMNCEVPCFWGIIPGQTPFDEAKDFFNHLGFTPSEGKYQHSDQDYYFITVNKSNGEPDTDVTLLADNNLVENIVLTPHVTQPAEGSPREWIAYSPETLIKRFGSPSRVQFAVGWQQSITINMIMYFEPSDLIVCYSGYGMDPMLFCPLTAPFDRVRLWLGPNPPDTPSFETVSLEKATSLTIDQFTQLMLGDPQEACFVLNGDFA